MIIQVNVLGFEVILMTSVKVGKGTIVLKEGDITEQGTDAVVNAANSGLMGGGGVDGAIHAAGGPRILEECVQIVKRIGRLPPGQAVITTAGDMRAKFVIHTVGPIWRDGTKGEAQILASCYTQSLKLAQDEGIRSISFPSISTGAYGYPLDLAAKVALKAVKEFLEQNSGIDEVFFVLWGKESFEAYNKASSSLFKPNNKKK
jgi:O-acetyl-ADP-ribose deacetylase (regulator of RNase III)